ncbi:MAG: bifunctional 4-hydroxy-2-oxoglutarate aldolase/2-dehydro-3-deoxy-phosphogluconate aldolase [Nocardioides sp.]|uniref:bifunctional 4-hydroxy-2-oxoglutarate aldolase/2-dehydro-3-deoxy-phosphogluconate aldolase n=1 Tax=Nocardioides sp. TaxID=35761 RepID=UPI0039E2AF88
MLPVLDQLADVGVIAVIRGPSPQAAVDGVRALVDGGITGIEITYTTPEAPAVMARIAREYGEDVLLGAGTVRTADDAARAADAGAGFLVAPGFEAALATAMTETGLTTMIGALTPTEVMAADAHGADVVKIFPASLHGPALIRNLRGPFPDVAFMPTGGVSADNVAAWVAAGVVAVGAGGDLVSTADLAQGRFDQIRIRARELVAAYRAARATTA